MKNDVDVTGMYTPLFPESFKIETTNFRQGIYTLNSCLDGCMLKTLYQIKILVTSYFVERVLLINTNFYGSLCDNALSSSSLFAFVICSVLRWD